MVTLLLHYDIIIAISSKLKDTFFWASELEGAPVKHPQLTPWGSTRWCHADKTIPIVKGQLIEAMNRVTKLRH